MSIGSCNNKFRLLPPGVAHRLGRAAPQPAQKLLQSGGNLVGAAEAVDQLVGNGPENEVDLGFAQVVFGLGLRSGRG